MKIFSEGGDHIWVIFESCVCLIVEKWERFIESVDKWQFSRKLAKMIISLCFWLFGTENLKIIIFWDRNAQRPSKTTFIAFLLTNLPKIQQKFSIFFGAFGVAKVEKWTREIIHYTQFRSFPSRKCVEILILFFSDSVSKLNFCSLTIDFPILGNSNLNFQRGGGRAGWVTCKFETETGVEIHWCYSYLVMMTYLISNLDGIVFFPKLKFSKFSVFDKNGKMR